MTGAAVFNKHFFAQNHQDWLLTFLERPNDIPSHATFNRVFRIPGPAPPG